MTDHIMTTYTRLPVEFEKGEGAWLWDTAGKQYLDALSGIAVCGLGHAHPAVAAALADQASKLLHTSNLYGIPLQTALAEKLCAISGMDRVFFSNSGAEANETAIKIARLYGHSRGVTCPAIIVMENSFHGRTMATLTATGNRKVQAGFEPLVRGFLRVPYNDIEAIEKIAVTKSDTVAILVEPIQGEAGINIPDADYLEKIRAICDRQEWLLMLDEVQTGMGRTGRWFAYQHCNIKPDVVTLAKSLGNGVPIGVSLARGKAAEIFQPGNHGSTFGGNQLVCRAGLTVIETIENDKLVDRAAELGTRITDGLRKALNGMPGIIDIRHQGLMIGIELGRPCDELVNQALDAGLLINVTVKRVIRLLPPLILTDEQADLIVDKLGKLIRGFLK